MRKLIAAMKISLDGKTEGSKGYADWVDGWSEDYGLTGQVDACVLGGRMWPGYEDYWTTMTNQPGEVLPQTGGLATPAELEWARLAPGVAHYVLSRTMQSTGWPNTQFLRGMDELAALKEQGGLDIYLMGGATVVAGAIEARLVDELRLIVYPLIAGEGAALFPAPGARHDLELHAVEQRTDGRLGLTYRMRSN